MEITKEDLKIEEEDKEGCVWFYKGLGGAYFKTKKTTKMEIFTAEADSNAPLMIADNYSLVAINVTIDEFFEKSLQLLNGAGTKDLGLELVKDEI